MYGDPAGCMTPVVQTLDLTAYSRSKTTNQGTQKKEVSGRDLH